MIAWLAIFACGQPDPQPNRAPSADAGPDLAVPADATFALDGRASTDPEGDTLQFEWRFDTVPAGSSLAGRESALVPNRDASGRTTFRPDRVGVYVVELAVWDGIVSSPADWVVVDVGSPEVLPLADAGRDVTVALGDDVLLDGRSSIEPQGADLAFAWALVETPFTSELGADALIGADTATPSFTPDAFGDYTVALVVTGGLARSLPDAVRIRVTGDDLAPVADAGIDAAVPECSYAPVDCTGSDDPEGGALTYSWDVERVPAGSAANRASFADPEAGITTFLPDVRGTYELSCSAWDGAQWSLPDTIAIEVAERTANQRPIVDAGNDRRLPSTPPTAACHPVETGWSCEACPAFLVDLGEDGSIVDPDNDPFVLDWEIANPESGGEILDPRAFPTLGRVPAIHPRFPDQCETVDVKFRVTVTDCPGDQARDTVVITAQCCGRL